MCACLTAGQWHVSATGGRDPGMFNVELLRDGLAKDGAGRCVIDLRRVCIRLGGGGLRPATPNFASRLGALYLDLMQCHWVSGVGALFGPRLLLAMVSAKKFEHGGPTADLGHRESLRA